MFAVFQEATAVSDTITASRGATAVNVVTAVAAAGLVVEEGVRDTTNGDLVFDPDSDTATYQVVKLVSGSETGAAAALVTLDFDEYAAVAQAPAEA
jgi:hypothetical protein